MKKRKFGAGKWNGFGGKKWEDETMLACALRELEEESTIVLRDSELRHVWVLHFFWEANPERDQDVHIFRGNYDGVFAETEEMKPQRFDTGNLPYNDMREDDSIWMPKLIAGEYLDMDFRFDKEGKLIK